MAAFFGKISFFSLFHERMRSIYPWRLMTLFVGDKIAPQYLTYYSVWKNGDCV